MAKYEVSHQVVVHFSDNQLEWREVEGRQLPALQLFATGIYQPPSRAVDAIAGRGRTMHDGEVKNRNFSFLRPLSAIFFNIPIVQ